jgi:ABC-type dipeptide/oligopeptide/nickel transport system permease component
VKEALRRLLWLGPTLLVVTIPTFWALARATDRVAPTGGAPLPVFVNLRPQGVRDRARAATLLVAQGGAEALRGERTLARLGGAALPHVLPQLDALGPDARGRVAASLSPVARRMGIGMPSDFESPEAAVLFWNRYWEEHSVDFRPQVVRRIVRRFAEHPSSLRRSEVKELDTYALEDLVDALRPLDTPDDAVRARHVADVAAEITGNPWTIGEGATLADARRVADRWERFWAEHRGDYVVFTGLRRIGATLLETRYGRWVEEVLRHGLGTVATGTTVSAVLAARAPTTFVLVLVALLAGYPFAVVAGLFAAAHRRSAEDRLLAAFALVAGSFTSVGLVCVVGGTAAPVSAFLVMSLAGAAGASRHVRALSARVLELPFLRTELAFGMSPARTAFRSLRLSAGFIVALAVTDLPGLFTAAFVVEKAYDLHGLAEMTVLAARTGDLAWLMTLALMGTLSLGLAQIGADVIHRMLDPRVRPPAARTGVLG